MKVINLVRSAAAAAAIAALAPSAFAADAGVDVRVNLTSQCKAKSTTNAVVNFGTYVAFTTTAVNAPATTVSFECTRSFGGTPVATWDGATGLGTVAGLQYTLSVGAGARTAGTAASTSTIGTGDTVDYVVNGTMPAGQAGQGAGSTVQSVTRTLTVAF